MDTFKTILTNERKDPVTIFERWGPFLSLWPGNSRTIETDDAEAMYAPFEKVTWLQSGEVKLVPRSGWRSPVKGRWTITCLNVHGQEAEHRIVGGRDVLLPRGIPRIVELLDLLDPMIPFKSLTIKRVPIESPSTRHPHYVHVEYELRDAFEDRDKKELDEIQKLIEAEQQKPADVESA